MRNLSLNDGTQAAIIPHLQDTEDMLARVATNVSGREHRAEVIAMPDLGFAGNVQRMYGGFFTGAVYHWESDVPFVPVDATVNSCGVSMYRLSDEIATHDEFDKKISDAINKTRKGCSYIWNFASGNHFVTYGTVEGSSALRDGPYLMMHSSAAEFKKQHSGLYPVPGNWYHDRIKVLADPQTFRFMRYIEGSVADKFIDLAQHLEQGNRLRHDYFAEQIAGRGKIEESITNEQHYGMPTRESVAIGCQWQRKQLQILLTAPGKPIYLIEPGTDGPNNVGVDKPIVLFPHGLGKESKQSASISYGKGSFTVNGHKYRAGDSLHSDGSFALRNFDSTKVVNGEVPDIIAAILKQCPGKILGTFTQFYSHHARSTHGAS